MPIKIIENNKEYIVYYKTVTIMVPEIAASRNEPHHLGTSGVEHFNGLVFTYNNKVHRELGPALINCYKSAYVYNNSIINTKTKKEFNKIIKTIILDDSIIDDMPFIITLFDKDLRC